MLRTAIFVLAAWLAATVEINAQCMPASTAAGAVDTCFGTNGTVTTDITNDRDYSRALALQSDGKIVVAGISGYSATAPTADLTVVRYNTDGSLDTSFDGDGIVITDIGPGTNDDDYCRGLAIQPDGKIIIGGRSFLTPSTYGLVVVRYNPDGSLDATFDGDGKAHFEMPAIIEMYGFALQNDGRILVAGRSFLNGVFSGLIVRFNSNGSLDTTFGTNGSTTASVSGIFSLALQPDGKILASGTQGPDPAFAIARLEPNGSLDTTFGTGGVTTFHPTVNDQNWFVKQRSDGQIFMGGHSQAVPGDARGMLLRFGSDGTLGQSLLYPDQNAFWNMAFQPDGKQLVVGASFVPFSGFTVKRFFDVNTPDASFNGGASAVKFLPANIPEASGVNAVVMTRDNKIVVAGSVTEQNNTTAGWRWAVTRMYTGLQAPHPERFDFDGDGKADLSIFRPSHGEWWYQRSSDGGNAAAQFGSAADMITPGDYTGDGRTDMAFWRPATGEWFVLRSEDYSYFSVPFGTGGDVPRPSDFDGDGKTDFVVYRPTQNTWFRINSIGLVSFRQFGISGDKPVTGDFDGDGRSDPAVFRPLTGDWWYQSSINNAQLAVRWGLSTDIPVPADYDGDGKTDISIYRPFDGTWYTINSSNGSFSFRSFGLASDVPVPADYDGDGKADVAVYRPSQGIWYLLRSAAGFAAIPFGISTDVPIPSSYVP